MPRISVAVGERRTLGMLPGDFAEDAIRNDAGPIGTYPEVNPLAQVMMSGSMSKTSLEANQCPRRPKPSRLHRKYTARHAGDTPPDSVCDSLSEE